MYSRIVTTIGLLFLFAAHSQAALKIEITEGVEGAEKISIVPFGWIGPGVPVEDLAEIIDSDLHRSGQFSPIARKDMLAKPTQPADVKYQNWRMLDVPYLVIGKVRAIDPQQYSVEFHLFDVYRKKELKGLSFSNVHRSKLRKVAHDISDVIYQELTGERGAFDTRLAYVKKMPLASNPSFRYWLFTADADTYNEQPVLRSKAPIISPAWSPDSKSLAFVVVRGGGQSIYIFNIETRQQEQITESRDKFSAPAWSPDGKQMAMVGLSDGSADLFVMNLRTKKKTQITRHWAIDTEPTWSPDGKSLVFTSERGGSPQLYRYNFASQEVERLTFEGKQNLRASFSPDGSMITFVHLTDDGKYHVGVLDLATKQMRLLTKVSHQESEHESPSFAPNGSMVIYAANYRNKRGVIAAVSVDGRVHQRFSHDIEAGEVREPAWSSFLD